ncbi:MAG: hypothetical protein QOD35_1153 [Nocardioidaceae bacterium]|jgi:hypothetical protein|nr:hypothetical protein [Nocardioidaceae bacterium]
MDLRSVGLAGRRGTAETDRPPDQRSAAPEAPADASSKRAEQIDAILAEAALRDDRAAIRAFEADQRDQTAILDAFVSGDDDGPAFRARQLAKADRDSAKADRIAAELDRYLLADLSASSQECDVGHGRRNAPGSIAPQQVVDSDTQSRRAHAV